MWKFGVTVLLMTDAFDANLLEVLPIDFGLSFSVCNNNNDDLADDDNYDNNLDKDNYDDDNCL